MAKKLNAKYIAIIIGTVIVFALAVTGIVIKTNQWRHNKSMELLGKAKNTTNQSDQMLLYEQAAAINSNEETNLAAGISALKLGDGNLAEHYLAKVRTSEGYFQLANTYYTLEDYNLATVNYQKSVDKNKTAENYLGLGRSYLKQGNLDSAKDALESSLGLSRGAEATNLLVTLGAETSETTVSLEQDPANGAVIRYNALQTLGYPHAAESVLQRAAEAGYVNRDILFTLANEQIAKGEYQSAYDYLARAKAIDPYYPQIYTQLVLVCGKLGKSDEARQAQDFLTSVTF